MWKKRIAPTEPDQSININDRLMSLSNIAANHLLEIGSTQGTPRTLSSHLNGPDFHTTFKIESNNSYVPTTIKLAQISDEVDESSSTSANLRFSTNMADGSTSVSRVYGPKFLRVFEFFKQSHIDHIINLDDHLLTLCLDLLVRFCCWARSEKCHMIRQLLDDNCDLRPEVTIFNFNKEQLIQHDIIYSF
jgi:hypothetical protein